MIIKIRKLIYFGCKCHRYKCDFCKKKPKYSVNSPFTFKKGKLICQKCFDDLLMGEYSDD